jgi:hypothetical protein
MGSQSVTNFSEAKKRRIQAEIRAYNPRSEDAGQLAMSAATAAIGPFTKTSSFVQSLGSPSIKTGLELLLSLADSLRGKPAAVEEALRQYNVSPQHPRPYAALAAGLTQALAEILSSAQKETASASAARDSLAQTLSDLLREERSVEADEASPQDIARALGGVASTKLAERFIDNAISSLVSQSLDAAREAASEELSPEKLAALKLEIRQTFAPELGRLLMHLTTARAKLDPAMIPAEVGKSNVLKELNKRWRIVKPKPIPQAAPEKEPKGDKKSKK